MLSKLKKKSDATEVTVPSWHLDFRDTDALPDMKPIRTAFFINGLAILIAAMSLLLFAYQELELYSLRSQIDDWDRQIEQDRAQSGQAAAAFKQFQAQERKIKETEAFLKTPMKLSTFLLRLGEILPENIKIDTIDWRGRTITLRGTVSGSPDEASGYASGMVELLNSDEVFGPVFDDAVLTSLLRNPASGMLALEIRLEFTQEAK
ncbi:hypothetical protein [Actomonas aquatica]|uniref:Fimbrial assembly protein n=1 Tax=Actomonas aquatica TaxID=2866162 RepID=A0ABZ1C5K1_9BACT|nr:hypothetical protein [Opitutus sp. WL0086]WRQ86796.1 hypothetical protein K1X11_018445 [Opitutus sp. WL0086]